MVKPNVSIYCSLKSAIYLFCFFLVIGHLPILNSQSNDPFRIQSLLSSETPKNKIIFGAEINNKTSLNNSVRSFKLERDNIDKIFNEFNVLISAKIPGINEEVTFYYTEYDFFTPDFHVDLLSENQKTTVDVEKGIHLKGGIKSGNNAFSSLSLFTNEIYGMAYGSDGLKISILPGQNPSECTLVDENKIDNSSAITECYTDDFRHFIGKEIETQYRLGDNCKIINVAINVDYLMFIKFNGDIQKITNYVTGLFNNVHTLYKRENISIALSEINIHSTKDGFSHLTANEDLDYFRKKYPNTNKTVKLLLSAYQKNNIASLGGISYINTLCNASYSYAFANVNGTYNNSPVYSWDVFLVTHELGHVLGSRHTHACVWGPLKNTAIDQCAKLEGSCSPPGNPTKGTLMSYCFQNGMPGIDLLLGFGTEPGNLIRQRVASSNCISSYLPENYSRFESNSSIEANLECSDGVYTHYYFDNNTMAPSDDILLLSINKKGNEIGTLNDGSLKIKVRTTKNYDSNKTSQITASYVDRSKNWYVSNKYWEINSSKTPTRSLNILYYFSKAEIEKLLAQGNGKTLNDLVLYNVSSPANPNPETNHANAQKENFSQYFFSPKPDSNRFIIYRMDTTGYRMELNTTKLNNSGVGIFIEHENFVNFISLQAQNKINLNTIDFETSKEFLCKHYVVERSINQIQFDSIGMVKAIGTTSAYLNYKFNYAQSENSNTVYRIKAVDQNNHFKLSPIFSAKNDYNSKTTLSVFPNPVSSGVLYIDFLNTTNNTNCTLLVSDLYGRIRINNQSTIVVGNNYFALNTIPLNEGLHYLYVITNNTSQKVSFNVSK